MNRSNELDKLFAALAKVQGVIKNPEKDKDGFNKNYKYAKLEQFIEVSQKLMMENGLSILQFPGSTRIVEITDKAKMKDGSIVTSEIKVPLHTVHTTIGHESGQFIELAMEIPAEKSAGMSLAQSIGAVITFARRYARGGVLGVCAEDEDTDAHVEQEIHQPKKPVDIVPQRLDQKEVEFIEKLLKDNPERIKAILEWGGVPSLHYLPRDKYSQVKTTLMNEVAQRLDKVKATG